MPPGLYEIVITDKSEGEAGAELLEGDFNVRIEERGLDDIRALGCNSIEDEREFEAVARVSQLNNALYSAFVRPWFRTWVTPQMASAVLAMQPLRLKYAMFSDKNPLMDVVAPLADKVRAERKAPDADNPFLTMQEQVSEMVTAWLEALGQTPRSIGRGGVPCGLWLALVAGLAGSDAGQRAAPAQARHVARSEGSAGGKDQRTPLHHGPRRRTRSGSAGPGLHRRGATLRRRPLLRNPAAYLRKPTQTLPWPTTRRSSASSGPSWSSTRRPLWRPCRDSCRRMPLAIGFVREDQGHRRGGRRP